MLIDVLRDLRGHATRDASDTYARVSADEAAIDDHHDELRAIEAMLMQLEQQRPDDSGRIVLVGETEVVSDVLRAGAREALTRLQHGHDGYPAYGSAPAGAALVDAAETAKAWLVTLVSFDQVNNGPDE